jgi:hypothetical protein
VFICPAGKVLTRSSIKGDKKGKYKYRASVRDCRDCALKSKCTNAGSRGLYVSGFHGYLYRLRIDSETAEFKTLYRRRAPVVEGIFAEGKQRHCLGRAWRRGLEKMSMQCKLIAAVLNYKRLRNATRPLSWAFSMIIDALKCLQVLYRGILSIIIELFNSYEISKHYA